MDKESIVRKIKALLEMAGRDPDSHEGKLAAERAGELLAKYKIAYSSIETEEECAVGREFCPIYMQENMLYEHHLITQIAHTFGCKAIKENGKFSVIGKNSDLELTLWYFKYLRMVISKKADKETSTKVARKSFGLGMVMSIGKRLKELMETQERNLDATTKDLVIIQDAKVEEKYRELYPYARRGGKYGRIDGQMYNKGIDQGNKISLSKPVGGGNSTTPSAII